MSITAWSNSFLVFLESSVVGVSIKMPDVVPKPSQTKSRTKIWIRKFVFFWPF